MSELSGAPLVRPVEVRQGRRCLIDSLAATFKDASHLKINVAAQPNNASVSHRDTTRTEERSIYRCGNTKQPVLGGFGEDLIVPVLAEKELCLFDIVEMLGFVSYEVNEDVIFLTLFI